MPALHWEGCLVLGGGVEKEREYEPTLPPPPLPTMVPAPGSPPHIPAPPPRDLPPNLLPPPLPMNVVPTPQRLPGKHVVHVAHVRAARV